MVCRGEVWNLKVAHAHLKSGSSPGPATKTKEDV